MQTKNVEFIDSIRGGKLLLYNNYIYRTDRKIGTTHEYLYWKCRSKNCRSRLKVENGEVVKVFAHCHNHVVKPGEVERLKTMNKLKNEIKKTPNRPVPEIYKQICADLEVNDASNDGNDKESDPAMKKITWQSLDSSLYRYRRKFLPQKPRVDHSNCGLICMHTGVEHNEIHKNSITPRTPKVSTASKPSTSTTTAAAVEQTIPSESTSMKSGKWITTYEGDKYLVVNDSAGDKIIAFVTPDFLDMLCPKDKAKITESLSRQ